MGDGEAFIWDHGIGDIESFAIHLGFQWGVVPANGIKIDFGSLTTLQSGGMDLFDILRFLLAQRAVHVKKAEYYDISL